jgi:hypothetical protein
MHNFLYYTDNFNPVHYNFTEIFMWIMQNTLINVHKYTYIVYNQLSITVETSLFIILLSSCIISTPPRLKLLSSTVPGKDLSIHPVKLCAVS